MIPFVALQTKHSLSTLLDGNLLTYHYFANILISLFVPSFTSFAKGIVINYGGESGI